MSPSALRLTALCSAGSVAGVVAALVAPWQLAVLGGWIVAAGVYLVSVWLVVGRADGAETRRGSTRDDDSRTTRGLIMVIGALASLPGAGFALSKATRLDGGAEPVLLILAAVAAVLVSWLAVHTDFTLRYAHLYYTAPVGGLEVSGEDDPDYRDFAYLAFTVGMCYQVSDTGLLSVRFRRTVLKHALLSYVFGAVIVAAVINAVAGLVN